MKQKIAIQGELGSYSHLAATKVFKNLEVITCKTFEDVFLAVKNDNNIKTVIPIENSIAGRVADVHYLLPKYKLNIVGEYFNQVHHCLLSIQEANISDIKIVKSHAHAIGQCQNKINKYKFSTIIEADTAGAAKKLKEDPKKDIGVIASELAAEIYNLKILEKGFEDISGNTTRFLIMSSDKPDKEMTYDKSKKYLTTCIFKLKSIPAALYKSLGGFAENEVNLTKLESFSVSNSFDQALFYLDIEGHFLENKVQASIEKLKEHTETIDILGVYEASNYRFAN